MTETLYFDALAVGDRWKSRGRTITETDVVNFAGMTGDYDPLHVDHEFARQTPFGKPIAHGLLGLAFVAGLGSYAPAIHTIAFTGIRDWAFRKPLLIGDTVYAVNEIVAMDVNNRRRGRVTWKRQLVNQRGEVLQEGIFETLVAREADVTERRDAGREERAAAQPPMAATPAAGDLPLGPSRGASIPGLNGAAKSRGAVNPRRTNPHGTAKPRKSVKRGAPARPRGRKPSRSD